jgi:hypothetical protein
MGQIGMSTVKITIAAIAMFAFFSGPGVGQESSIVTQIRSELQKRAQGIGVTEQNACVTDLRKKLPGTEITIKSWELNTKLLDYISYGGWPGRSSNPRYHTTFVIMNARFDTKGVQALFAPNAGTCLFNRKDKGFEYLAVCFPGTPCILR